MNASLQDSDSCEASLAKNSAVSTELNGSVAEQLAHPLGDQTGNSSLCTADSKQKSKKQKRDKPCHADLTENSSDDVVHRDVSTVTCNSSIKSEIKKKKKKHQEEVMSTEVNIVCENGNESGAVVADDDQRKSKKSSKKRKWNSDLQSASENVHVQNATEDFCKRSKTADGKNFSL